MIGALGACFGRVVTMDSPQRAAAGRVPVGGDAVARAGARHHAADVEPARAALADRRHLGLRGEAGARRVGARDGHDVRRHAQPRRDAEAEGPERGVHRSEARSRSPTSRRRCWSSTSSTPTATTGCTSCCAPTARGSTPTRRCKAALEHRPRPDAGRLRPDASRRCSATMRAALHGTAGGRRSLPKMPLRRAEDDTRRQARGQLPGADGARRRRCAKAGELDEAMQAFERAAALVPMAAGDDSPQRADGGDRAAEEGHRARDRRAAGAGRRRLQQRRGGAAARRR